MYPSIFYVGCFPIDGINLIKGELNYDNLPHIKCSFKNEYIGKTSSKDKGYVLQNNLTKNTWIEIKFRTITLTGVITIIRKYIWRLY